MLILGWPVTILTGRKVKPSSLPIILMQLVIHARAPMGFGIRVDINTLVKRRLLLQICKGWLTKLPLKHCWCASHGNNCTSCRTDLKPTGENAFCQLTLRGVSWTRWRPISSRFTRRHCGWIELLASSRRPGCVGRRLPST